MQPIVNYTVQFTIIPKATILNNDLYLAWFGLNNISNGRGSIYMSITTLPYQESQYNTNTNIMNNTSTISTSSTYSYSSIQSTNTTSNKSLFSSIPIWVIILIVGVVVFIILY